MNVDFVLTRQDWTEAITAAVIFAVTVAIAFLVPLILRFFKARLAARTQTTLDDTLLSQVGTPAILAILLGGLYLTLLQISALDAQWNLVRTYFVVAVIVVAALSVARFLTALLSWYGVEIAHRTKTDLDAKLVPILRRVTNLVVYAVALILILDRLGVEISPLIAGLGIGGLAIALAVQPSLASFLAGTYVQADGVIKKGDFIELDSGQAGYVEEIGWRTTKVRHWQGNLIVLPNSRLADAIVTDYEAPEPPMLVLVPCGVSYSSDLQKVEDVSLEVAGQVIQDCPDSIKDFEPVLRFREFGDSNINFVVILRAVNRVGQFVVRHEFIKALHKRFNEEGIEIQYPARKLHFSGELPLRVNRLEMEELIKDGAEGEASDELSSDS